MATKLTIEVDKEDAYYAAVRLISSLEPQDSALGLAILRALRLTKDPQPPQPTLPLF